MTYTITIKDLQAHTTLGIYDWEKEAPRLVVLNVSLEVAAPQAATTDDMQHSVDYATIESAIVSHLKGASFQLLERLVTEVGQLVLALDERIRTVTVEADKPGALRQARSVSVSATCRR